jgi:hypothetical protein
MLLLLRTPLAVRPTHMNVLCATWPPLAWACTLCMRMHALRDMPCFICFPRDYKSQWCHGPSHCHLQAVRDIHELRIVHSDLKPANFLLVEGQLKLIDFGIAKAISNDTTSIARESQVREAGPACAVSWHGAMSIHSLLHTLPQQQVPAAEQVVRPGALLPPHYTSCSNKLYIYLIHSTRTPTLTHQGALLGAHN